MYTPAPSLKLPRLKPFTRAIQNLALSGLILRPFEFGERAGLGSAAEDCVSIVIVEVPAPQFQLQF
mgnify:CR=1 FL=1